MTTTLELPAAPRREASRASSQRHQDVLRLMALRLIEDAGPSAGIDVLDRIAPMARRLQVAAPTFPLLHELLDAGLVTASAELPRRYAITAVGRQEAERLATAWWPSVRDLLGQRSERVARVFRRPS